MKKAVKSAVKDTKPAIALNRNQTIQKVFIAYDGDTSTIVQTFRSMPDLKLAYWRASLQNADLEWVVVESDVVKTSAIRNEISIIDFKK